MRNNPFNKAIIEYNATTNKFIMDTTINDELKNNLTEIDTNIGSLDKGMIQITGVNDNFQFSLCLPIKHDAISNVYKFDYTKSAFTCYEFYDYEDIEKYTTTNILKINIFENNGYNNKQEFSRVAPGYISPTSFDISKDKYENNNISSRYFAVPMYNGNLDINGDLETGTFNLLHSSSINLVHSKLLILNCATAYLFSLALFNISIIFTNIYTPPT